MCADYYNLVREGLACDLGFDVGAGFVFSFVVLSVDFVSCLGEGCFYEVGGGG